ncbi:large conductance mechanosensitive channel protein MscL [Bacillus taeanensis]|uniref:Large-conductance mechanosensitive channel n=1 Tax=Bacillus taeanensis TaxID=273032 RepID=A0A366XZX9_9BACI|nr:large conductance mechanosensitive channel protein MscL [Bacillus taeanensis]RBW71156.1 large conductance mechanosensitive channel protein MscL [Bacillus taeanensis]
MFKEFRQFAMKGNVADMGIGMVIGAAFGNLIDSLVKDIMLPPIGLLLAQANISNLFINLSGGFYPTLADAHEAGAATINYGLFLTTLLRFIIVMFAVFLVVRQINRFKKPNENPLASMTKKECPYCCSAIPSQAVRCPSCTSQLRKAAQSTQDKKANSLHIKIH